MAEKYTYKEGNGIIIKKIANILFDNKPYVNFEYENVKEFMEKITKISDELVGEEEKGKITLKFHSKELGKVSNNFYSILEFLLFVNGMQTVKYI